MPISVPLARGDQDPGPAVHCGHPCVLCQSLRRAYADFLRDRLAVKEPPGRLVWRINPKKAARLRSLIADEVVAPADMGSGQGREAQPDPFGHLSKIISRL